MKTSKPYFALIALVFVGLVWVSAQSVLLYPSSVELVEFPPLDLPLAPAEVVSESGTFYSAGNPDWPPLPGLVGARQSLPVYSLAAEFGQPAGAPYFLVDDRQFVGIRGI